MLNCLVGGGGGIGENKIFCAFSLVFCIYSFAFQFKCLHFSNRIHENISGEFSGFPYELH